MTITPSVKRPHKRRALLLCVLILAGLTALYRYRDAPPDGGSDDILLVNGWTPLPPDYDPGPLRQLSNGQQVAERCYRDLQQMLADCAAAGHAPWVCSGYRSRDTQSSLYAAKVEFYRTAGYDDASAHRQAAAVVAPPDTSEHQTGLAVDLTDSDYTALDEGQADTATQQWLMANCSRYGFILRYPPDKTALTGIIYEPWHYRYVGVEAAEAITAGGLTLEEYLAG